MPEPLALRSTNSGFRSSFFFLDALTMGSRIRSMSQGETDAIPPLANETGSHDRAA